MPRTVKKTLTFPLAGVARRRGYRDQPRPYAAPWAMNVRGSGPLEDRDRGGSRPGLSKVNATKLGAVITALLPITSIDSTGARNRDLVIIADGILYNMSGTTISTVDADLLWPDDAIMLWDDGEEVVFDSTVSSASPIGDTNAYHAAERGGKLYLADSVLRVYDPNTGVIDPVSASDGEVPTAQPVIAAYRDRIILTGANHIWYASRTSDPTDWDYGAEMTDATKPVAGQLGLAADIGNVPKAVIPFRDKVLIFACANSMWQLRGDPGSGKIDIVSEDIGIIAPEAWARTPDGTLAFLSNDGVYIWGIGSSDRPMRFSEERLPDQLRNVDATTNQITMAYSPKGRGFHLFITPDAGGGTHWWLDINNKAIWPVKLQNAHEPLAVARVESSGLAEVILGCNDGYLRKFSTSASTDDGYQLNSHVLLGPFRISQGDTTDALVSEIHGIMADNDDFVDWNIFMGDSAETVTDQAVAGINSALIGQDSKDVKASGRWEGLRNKVKRPRTRGPWVVVWLSAEGSWSYEAVAIVAKQLGRLR